jgi:hypothetical protein
VQNELVTTLRIAFGHAVTHRLPREGIAYSKKWGALYLANILVEIFFRQDQLRQCVFFISAVEGKGFPPLSGFPLSQVSVDLCVFPRVDTPAIEGPWTAKSDIPFIADCYVWLLRGAACYVC